MRTFEVDVLVTVRVHTRDAISLENPNLLEAAAYNELYYGELRSATGFALAGYHEVFDESQ